MKFIVKRTSFLILLIVLSYQLFAHGGVMTGMHDLKIINTTYFDIIYPPESEETACLVAARVDGLYESICADLHEEPWLRMPITITPTRDQLNAYFTPAYYNMIVLYDTVPTESLAVFKDNIINVLYHELVHAVTMNMKSTLLKKYSKLFGDLFSFSYITAPLSVLEGTAVAFESKSGEGRLNDPFSTQLVKQGKLEGKFPSYTNTFYARDIYPMGAVPYVIGGSFITWLYDTYGGDTFTSYWRTIVSLSDNYAISKKEIGSAFPEGPFNEVVFKKIYGISSSDAWNSFYQAINVPNVAADPVASGDAADYFVVCAKSNPPAKKLSVRKQYEEQQAHEQWNKQGSRYVSVTSCKNGVAWIDASCSTAWYSALTGTHWQKPRKLFTLTNLSRISFSSDGAYLAVSCAKTNATIKFYVGVYSMKNGRLVLAKQDGLRDATVVTNADGTHALVAIKTHSQFTNLSMLPLKEKNLKCSGFIQPVYHEAATWNRIPFSVCDIGKGKVAYIAKDGISWSIQLYDTVTNITTSFVPSNTQYIMQNLAPGAEENTFLFSWGERGKNIGMLPRLGMLDIRDGEPVWSFQSNDISGGVHYPAVLPGAKSTGTFPTVVYSGQFYDNTKLLILSAATTAGIIPPTSAADDTNAGTGTDTILEAARISEQVPDTSFAKNAHAYHELSYYKKGVFFPIGIVPVSDEKLNQSLFSLLGATWYTSNPWRDKVLFASVCIDPLTLTGGVFANLTGGTDSDIFKYVLSGTAVFDSYGFCQTLDTLSVSSGIPVGKVSQLTFSAASNFFAGESRSIMDELNYKSWFKSPEHTDNMLVSKSSGAVKFSTIHQTGPGRFEKSGVFASVNYSFDYSKTLSTDIVTQYHNLGATAGFQVPQLFSSKNPYGLTCNFPFTATSELFSDPGCFEKHTATIVLLSAEVQQPIDILHLYLNRVTFEASYTGSLKYDNPQSWDFLRTADLLANYKELSYYDTASFTAHTYLRLNEGEAAQFPFDVSSTLYYRIHPEADEQTWGFGMFGTILF